MLHKSKNEVFIYNSTASNAEKNYKFYIPKKYNSDKKKDLTLKYLAPSSI